MSIYSRQAGVLPGRKELSQHLQFGLRKLIVLRTTRVLVGLTSWDSRKSEASPQRMSVCPSGKDFRSESEVFLSSPPPNPGLPSKHQSFCIWDKCALFGVF